MGFEPTTLTLARLFWSLRSLRMLRCFTPDYTRFIVYIQWVMRKTGYHTIQVEQSLML